MDKKIDYIKIAKRIIGNWGYEEKSWWEPIAKALEREHNQTKQELLSEAIKIFEPYRNEPMTGNVVILELQVMKDPPNRRKE